MIVEKEFDFDLEGVELIGTVVLDISDDIPRVKKVIFNSDNLTLLSLKDLVSELIYEDDRFNAIKLREEERQWREAEDADAMRKEID